MVSRHWTVRHVLARSFRDARLDPESVWDAARDAGGLLLVATVGAATLASVSVVAAGPRVGVPLASVVGGLTLVLALTLIGFQRIRGLLAATDDGLPRDTSGVPRAWDETPMVHTLVIALPVTAVVALTVTAAAELLRAHLPALAVAAVAVGGVTLVVALSRLVVAPLLSAQQPGFTTPRLLAATLDWTRPVAGRLVLLLTVFALVALVATLVLGLPCAWLVHLLNTTGEGIHNLLLLLALVALLLTLAWLVGALALWLERALILVWIAGTGGAVRPRLAAVDPATPDVDIDGTGWRESLLP